MILMPTNEKICAFNLRQVICAAKSQFTAVGLIKRIKESKLFLNMDGPQYIFT